MTDFANGSPSSPIAAMAMADGEALAVAANQPVRLVDAETVWFIESGALDLFFLEEKDQRTVSNLVHIMRLEAGRLVFPGRSDTESGSIVIGKGLPGTRLRGLSLNDVAHQTPVDEFASEVDRWIVRSVTALVSEFTLRPRKSMTIAPGETVKVKADNVLAGRTGVTWVRTAGSAEFLGTERLALNKSGFAPLTAEAWLSLHEAEQLRGLSSSTLHRQGDLLSALAGFHGMLTGARLLNQRLMMADLLNADISKLSHRRRTLDAATDQLFGVLRSAARRPAPSRFPLVNALTAISEHEGIAFRLPANSATQDHPPTLADILCLSGVRSRQVMLSRSENWWENDSNALLGFLDEDRHPVALIPNRARGYRMIDPRSGTVTALNRRLAERLSEDAHCFYRPLPSNRPAQPADMVRHARHNIGADLVKISVVGLLAGLAAMIPAILIGVMVKHVIPLGSTELLAQLAAAMVAVAVIGFLLHILKGMALMRLEGRVENGLTAAMWDRTLDLPARFYRRHPSGALATRSSTFLYLRDALSGTVLDAFLSMVFLLPAFAVILVYDTGLGLTSMGMAGLFLAFTIVSARLQTVLHERRQSATRRISGEMLQFVCGVAKLRSSGTESSALAVWSRHFHDQLNAHLKIGRLADHVVALSAALPAITTVALFAFVPDSDALPLGDFLIIYALLMTLTAAAARLGQSFESIAAAVPIARQTAPVLAECPASARDGDDMPELSGDIAFDHVSFRYTPESALALSDMTLTVKAGEFVAIVGESGSGKSTLIRLALGLETPSAGAVYLDGRDLTTLNPRIVRRQVGVVIQDCNLRHGNILENIIGNSEDLTSEDAWKAAAQASVDKDITRMPMGMFTIVGNGATAFSGGQAQRISLAAALVRRPRILFLDEATSWLDANIQAQVMSGIERLPATRIAVAHRLSTIRRADRIYVFDKGRIVQRGTFDALSEREGPFRRLMMRQLA